MSDPLHIGVILSTTRPGRFADKPAAWFLDIASKRTDARFELVDLRDYPMPFFEESRSPMVQAPASEVALRFGKKMAELDGYVFITAEYNHGIPAVLKNAIDYVYTELNRKPASFVAYGNAGGARAVEQLRLVLAELQMASLKHSVHIGYAEFLGMLMKGQTFADFPYLESAAMKLVDDLVWWARTLRAGRLAEQTPDDALR